MNQENRPKEQKNSFWDIFRFTKNGRPQSDVIVMTFSYGLLFLAIDLISYFTLIDLVNALLGGGPTWLENLAESLVPAIVGAVICALPLLWVREKRYVPMAYVWLACYAVALFVAMTITLHAEAEARNLFLRLYLMTVPAPILLGGGLAGWLYRRYRKKNPPLEEPDSWKRL